MTQRKRTRYDLDQDNLQHDEELEQHIMDQQQRQSSAQPDLSNQRLKVNDRLGPAAVRKPRLSNSSQFVSCQDSNQNRKQKRFVKIVRSSDAPTMTKTIETSSSQTNQIMGLEKRRLIDQFEQLNLGLGNSQALAAHQQSFSNHCPISTTISQEQSYSLNPVDPLPEQKKKSSKRQLIQVLKSETFADCDSSGNKDSSFSEDCFMSDNDANFVKTSTNNSELLIQDNQNVCLNNSSLSRGSFSVNSRNLNEINGEIEEEISDQSSNSSQTSKEAAGLMRFKLADDSMSSQLKTVTERNFIADSFQNSAFAQKNLASSSMRSRSWDGRTLGNQISSETQYFTGGQIELRSKVQSSQVDLLTSFFKFYLQKVMTNNEQLNNSYLHKLKAEYNKFNNGQKIKMEDLEQSLQQVSRDVEMTYVKENDGVTPSMTAADLNCDADMAEVEASNRGQERKAKVNGLIADFLYTNTNYFELRNDNEVSVKEQQNNMGQQSRHPNNLDKQTGSQSYSTFSQGNSMSSSSWSVGVAAVGQKGGKLNGQPIQFNGNSNEQNQSSRINTNYSSNNDFMEIS